ncbi:MAG: response regulator, partial [Microcoleus sp.]
MSSNSILIVDDTPNNIRLLFDLLNRSGFVVSVVKSGETALQKLPQIQPDLILLDVMMPGIDGFETCRRIKANPEHSDIPIIFMTALSDTERIVTGLQLGAVDYITKPIQFEEVLARVNIHL